jgi:hypothetical protein
MIDSSQVAEQFRKNGSVAFCPNCGVQKSQARQRCKGCKASPRKDVSLFVRSMLMSTEKWYLREKWKKLTPEENKAHVEREILPEIIAKANVIRNGGAITFDEEEEKYWTGRITRELQQKMPLPGVCILVAMWGWIVFGVVAVVIYFFF